MARDSYQAKASIPTIDLKAANAATKLLDAAITWGFVFIKHNDISNVSPEDVAELFSLVFITMYISEESFQLNRAQDQRVLRGSY